MAEIETKADRDLRKAIEERDAHEVMLDRFVEAMGGVDACGEHTSNNCPWHVALEEAGILVQQRDALLAALENLMDSLDRDIGEFPGRLTLDAARAAIAAAKGE